MFRYKIGRRRGSSEKYQNAITNGNILSTAEWAEYKSDISANNNILTVTGDGTQGHFGTLQITSTPLNVNNKYYLNFAVRVTNPDATEIYAEYDGSLTGANKKVVSQSAPVKDAWYRLSVINTPSADATGNIKFIIYSKYVDAATATGKVMECQEFIAYDLTARFGAGNEPSLAWCDANIPQNIIWGPGIKNAFADGTFTSYPNWDGLNGTLTIANNTATVTGDGTGSFPALYQTTAIPCTIGRKIYVRARARVTNAVCTNLRFDFKNSTGATVVATAANIATPTQNTWYDFSYIAIIGTASDYVRPYLRHTYSGTATANEKVMECQNAICYDLTARFGVGNEPDLAWCNANITPQNIIW